LPNFISIGIAITDVRFKNMEVVQKITVLTKEETEHLHNRRKKDIDME